MLKQHLSLNPKTTDLTQLASRSAWALHVTSPLLGLQPCATMPNFHIGATDLNLGPHVSSASAFISWAISVAKASFEKFKIKKKILCFCIRRFKSVPNSSLPSSWKVFPCSLLYPAFLELHLDMLGLPSAFQIRNLSHSISFPVSLCCYLWAISQVFLPVHWFFIQLHLSYDWVLISNFVCLFLRVSCCPFQISLIIPDGVYCSLLLWVSAHFPWNISHVILFYIWKFCYL